MRWIIGAAAALLVANFLPGLYVVHPTLGAIGYILGIALIFFVAPSLFVIGLVQVFRSARGDRGQ